MSNSLPLLREVILDYDNYLLFSEYLKSKADKLDKEFVLESINFYEKHKNDADSPV